MGGNLIGIMVVLRNSISVRSLWQRNHKDYELKMLVTEDNKDTGTRYYVKNQPKEKKNNEVKTKKI